jgi:cell division septation protein DedD
VQPQSRRLAFQNSPPWWVFTVKERLTGAIILVALIVLLVPELLSGPVRSVARAAAVAPSSAEEPPLRSYTINLADDAHSRGAASQTSGPQQPAPVASGATPATDGAATASTTPDPVSATRDAAAESPRAAPEPSPPAAGAGTATAAEPPAAAAAAGAFVVQLGSFASRANADHLARQVRAQGFQVSVSQGSSGRHLYRVRVGPAHDRAAATALAQQLRAAGHSGSVVPKQ